MLPSDGDTVEVAVCKLEIILCFFVIGENIALFWLMFFKINYFLKSIWSYIYNSS